MTRIISMVMHDLIANRPTPDQGHPPFNFASTDTNSLSHWTGTEWMDFPSGGGGPHHLTHENGGTDEVSVAGLSGVLADAQTPAAHSHAESDVTSLVSDLAGKAASSHTHNASDVNAGTVATARLGSGTASGSTFLRGDQTWAAPGGGSDPWSYSKVSGSDFTTTSATAVDVTGLAFTPSANTSYEFEAMVMLRTATTTVNPRLGFAWPTGMTDGVAMIEEAQAVNTVPLAANGNVNAALLIAVGGLPNTTQSWPARIDGMVVAGSSPSGTVRVQLASETAGTTVRAVIGSFIRWRVI